jgi:two-component system, chemotaxis family, chemotaxis protein CheY
MGLGRVLVVDDEADVRKSVRLTLTKAGYEVIDANDGEEAIKAIKSGDNPLMIDAVVCDIHMPKVNGVEAILYFQDQFPSVPIIVMTGDANLDRATTLLKKGVADYLIKPVAPQILLAAVHKAAKEHVYKDRFAI